MPIDWVTLGMGLAGGLALFLIGMAQITNALKALGDDRLRFALARLSSNRVLGATTGAVVTAVIQSSSVTTVLTVGFVSASLLSLTQAAGVIIGANLGTTVTAQIIALKVTDYALGLLAAGALFAVVVNSHRLRHLGQAIAGLGLVFLGMDTMSTAMAPLGTYQPFLDLMADASNPAVALLIGAVFTGLVQSSSATTGIVVVMAADGLIDLETGIAIVLGANIGTCVTALLAAIGKGAEAMRAAATHVAVNVIGASVWVFLIGPLADLVRRITPDAVDATPRQIANAHTIFNLANTVVFLVMLTPLVALVRRIVPDSAGAPADEEAQAAFLDPDLVETPVLALEMAHRELLRLGLFIREVLADSVPTALTGSRTDLDELLARDTTVDALHGQIVAYLAEIGRGPLGEDQRADRLAMLEAVNSLEQLADAIEAQIVTKGYQRIDGLIEVSDGTVAALRDLHRAALDTLDLAIEALGERSRQSTRRVLETKGYFRELEEETSAYLASRLDAADPQRVQSYTFEMELVNAMRLVHRNCRRVARSLRPEKGQTAAAVT